MVIDDSQNGGNGSAIGLMVFVVVAIFGVSGYFFYSRKQKEKQKGRTESLFVNGSTSPPIYSDNSNIILPSYSTLSSGALPAYSTLSPQRAPPAYSSISSLRAPNMNDINNLTLISNVDSNQCDYNDQYDMNCQYGNRFSENNYGNTVVESNVAVADTETNVTINDPIQMDANYENRPESMIPRTRFV